MTTEVEDVVSVQMVQLMCEYCYSNPTGMFNLSITDREWAYPVGVNSISYANYLKRKKEREQRDEKGASQIDDEPEDADDEDIYDNDDEAGNEAPPEPEDPYHRFWEDNALIGDVLIKVVAENLSGE